MKRTLKLCIPILLISSFASCRGGLDWLTTKQEDPRPNTGANTLTFQVDNYQFCRAQRNGFLSSDICLIATYNSLGDSLQIRSLLDGSLAVSALGESFRCTLSPMFLSLPVEKLESDTGLSINDLSVRLGYDYSFRPDDSSSLERGRGVADINEFEITVLRYDKDRNVISGRFTFSGTFGFGESDFPFVAADGEFDIRINSRIIDSYIYGWQSDFALYFDDIKEIVVPEVFAESTDKWVWQDGAWYNVGVLPL